MEDQDNRLTARSQIRGHRWAERTGRKQLAELGVTCKRGQTVNLLDTQIGLVEAEQGIAIIPSFGIPDCRRRGLTMSELIEPVVSLEFYQITRRGAELAAEATEFSQFLKRSIVRWAGEAGIL